MITSNPITFNSFYPTYDGNGNVSEYLSANGTIAAHFEYDPFGNTVVNTDTGNLFAYRFSTKPLEFATGLYYYGYRYYDPMTGRWPSRDPIEERGGMNLYGFVENYGINKWDNLGLACCYVAGGMGPPQEYEPKFECCVNGAKKTKISKYVRDYGGNLEACKNASIIGVLAGGAQVILGGALGIASTVSAPAILGYAYTTGGAIVAGGIVSGVGAAYKSTIVIPTRNNAAGADCQRLVCPN